MSKVSSMLLLLLFVFFFEAASGGISAFANNEVENRWLEIAKKWFTKFAEIARGNDTEKLEDLFNKNYFIFVDCERSHDRKELMEIWMPPDEIKYHFFDLQSYKKTKFFNKIDCLQLTVFEHLFTPRRADEYVLYVDLTIMKMVGAYKSNCDGPIDEDSIGDGPMLIVG